jgi:hypothetical protein
MAGSGAGAGLEALKTATDSVHVFARLHQSLKVQPISHGEILEEWSQYVKQVEPRTKGSSGGDPSQQGERAQADGMLGEMLSTLSRLLHEQAVVAMESSSGSADVSPSGSFAGSASRGTRVGGIRGLPRHGTEPRVSPKRALDEGTLDPNNPQLQHAPPQKELEGGLTEAECTGFLLE